jgi:hypothetical protein
MTTRPMASPAMLARHLPNLQPDHCATSKILNEIGLQPIQNGRRQLDF